MTQGSRNTSKQMTTKHITTPENTSSLPSNPESSSVSGVRSPLGLAVTCLGDTCSSAEPYTEPSWFVAKHWTIPACHLAIGMMCSFTPASEESEVLNRVDHKQTAVPLLVRQSATGFLTGNWLHAKCLCLKNTHLIGTYQHEQF